jgi:hypothetical protein
MDQVEFAATQVLPNFLTHSDVDDGTLNCAIKGKDFDFQAEFE